MHLLPACFCFLCYIVCEKLIHYQIKYNKLCFLDLSPLMCCSKNQLGIVAGCYSLLISSNQNSVGYQVKALQAQVEQEQQKKSALQSEVGLVSSEVAHLRARETQLTREVIQLREGKKSVEEELHKVKAARSVDNLQMKELQDQLEAEQYFSVCFLIIF